jgi:hypothetical protein
VLRGKGSARHGHHAVGDPNEQLTIHDELKKRWCSRSANWGREAGDIEKALGYYKDVYGADISFEDIATR